MAVYEFSNDVDQVREAERVLELTGRDFPTLVIGWEASIFGQRWAHTVVQDYQIALPPLPQGWTFYPVRVAAYVGDAPTKYFYFGTEMSDAVPRVAPEMENTLSPEGTYHEFQLDESSCPIPYTKLINATPRVYGNGAQDYYAPPISVERFDGVVGPKLMADLFPEVVAALPPIGGNVLFDPSQGMWRGTRFVGVRKLAILRAGVVVGLAARAGKADAKEVAPSEIPVRDPNLDVRDEWVSIDFGTRSCCVAIRGQRGQPTLVRIGTRDEPVVQAEFENPTEIAFVNVTRSLKAWRERVVFPVTRIEDLRVGFAARAFRDEADQARRTQATIVGPPSTRDYLDEKRPFVLCGAEDGASNEKLKRPVPPVIDEEGIGAHDPFDPVELYAYYIGLHVNHRERGLHLKYTVSLPTAWSAERRKDVLVAIRRGLFRSLPAGLVEYHDLESFIVEDAGTTAVSYAATAFRAFSIQPREAPVNFGILDVGASGAGVLFGTLREANAKEATEGYDRTYEYLPHEAMPGLGGEAILHRLAHMVYAQNLDVMQELRIPFEPSKDADESLADAAALVEDSPQGRGNAQRLRDLVRPLLEGDATAKVASSIELLDDGSGPVTVELKVERVRLRRAIDQILDKGVTAFLELLDGALSKIARGVDPYEDLRIILGGRVGMHPKLQQLLERALPGVRVHRFREPDRTNINAPTVKTAVALGALALRLDKILAIPRQEQRDAFRFRVGRARHGQLTDALDPTIDYDEWVELGPVSQRGVEIRYMTADDDGEVAADDPRVISSTCEFNDEQVGMRAFVRAVNTASVQVSVAAPGDEPSAESPVYEIDLRTGEKKPVS